jgi:hypothetical protein
MILKEKENGITIQEGKKIITNKDRTTFVKTVWKVKDRLHTTVNPKD